MRLCLIFCALALAACGRDTVASVYVPADLLAPAPGWTGPPPATERALILAAAAEKRGREQANAQLAAIAQIVE